MSLTVEEIIAAAAQLPEDDRLRLVQALSAGGTGSPPKYYGTAGPRQGNMAPAGRAGIRRPRA